MIIFGLKLSHWVFAAAEQFSTSLQVKDITMQEANRGAELLVPHLQSLRKTAKFDHFHDQVVEQSSNFTLTEQPKLPQSQKLPKKLDEGACPHRYLIPKDKYRHVYFEVLELADGEIERWFNQSDLQLIKELELLLIKAGNGEKVEPISESVWKYLENDVDPDHLMVQLSMIPILIKTAFSDNVTIKVTNVMTIADAMNQNL